MKKTCEFCKTEFNASHSNIKCCSHSCRSKLSANKRTRVCEYCQKEFVDKWESAKYCSKKCYSLAHRYKFSCANCGKESYRKKYKEGLFGNNYCCRRCYLNYLDKLNDNQNVSDVEFYKIDKFDKYEISKSGIVRAIDTKHIRKSAINSRGYLVLRLNSSNNKPFTVTVHRLVALTFIKNPNKYPQINHKDGNKCNNNVNNLEWCDAEMNMRHARKLGLNKGNVHGINGTTKTAKKEIIKNEQQ